jgi:hypothetical protein
VVHNLFGAARAISHCSLRSRGSRLGSRCLPRSLADEKRVCSLVRPGQRRAILGALGSAYFVVARRRKTCLLAPPQHGGRAIAAD